MPQRKRLIFWLVFGGIAGTFVGLKSIEELSDILIFQFFGYIAGLFVSHIFGFIYYALKKSPNPLKTSTPAFLKQALVIMGFGFLGTLVAFFTYQHFVNLLICQIVAHGIGIVLVNRINE